MIIGSNITRYDVLPSTNRTAISLASSGMAREGTVIRAGYQTAGKGQPGNTWESESGKNLLFSIILFPSELLPEDQFIVSMAICTGIHDFVSGIVRDCTIKWPNDIFVGNDKIAGILIESTLTGNSIDYMVAGIGLNVNQEVFQTGKNPVSLKILTGKTFDIEDVFSRLLQFLDRRYAYIREGRNEELKADYLERFYKYNEWSEFIEKDKTFTGRILTVGNDGGLLIEKRSGKKSLYYFKEIEFRLPSPSI